LRTHVFAQVWRSNAYGPKGRIAESDPIVAGTAT
jgi:hypothetical protein